MNIIKARNKISVLGISLCARMEELHARKSDVETEIYKLNAAHEEMAEQADDIDTHFYPSQEWAFLVEEIDDIAREMEDQIVELQDEVEDLDEKISAVEYAFEAAFQELDTGRRVSRTC